MMGASNLNNVINLMNQNINSMIASSNTVAGSACLQQGSDPVTTWLSIIVLIVFIGWIGGMVYLFISDKIDSFKEKRNKHGR